MAAAPLSNRLLLVDGHAAAYRFHYGIRSLSTRDGFPLQAIFGFIRLMQQLRAKWKPTHLLVAFDGGLPASRLDLVPTYKAQRKPMPDELRQQLPVLTEYLDAAAMPSIRLEDVEADDVIATVARRFSGDILLASHDKDLFQLVDDQTRMLPLSGDAAPLDEAGVVAKTGVAPARIPDWLALVGDTADNIPGVPGVGPKTAAALVQQFASLDAMFAGLEDVPRPRLRDVLAENQELVYLNRQMVLLDDQVPGVPDEKALGCQPEPVKPLLDFYEKYELRSFAQQLRAPDLFG